MRGLGVKPYARTHLPPPRAGAAKGAAGGALLKQVGRRRTGIGRSCLREGRWREGGEGGRGDP